MTDAPYIQCAGARTMDLLNPCADDIDVRTMAWSLAHLNRYTGHAGVYSVAEHLVLGTRYLEARRASATAQILYLFHDAHEAYTGDVSAPVKVALRKLGESLGVGVDAWKAFERIHEANVRVWLLHNCRTTLPHTGSNETAEVTACVVDLRMLIAETDQLAALGGRVGDGWPRVEPVDVQVAQWPGEVARVEFLREVERLAPELLDNEVVT